MKEVKLRKGASGCTAAQRVMAGKLDSIRLAKRPANKLDDDASDIQCQNKKSKIEGREAELVRRQGEFNELIAGICAKYEATLSSEEREALLQLQYVSN